MNRIGFIVASILILLMVLTSTLFVVDQRQFAVVYSMGEIRDDGVVREPGLKWKQPPPFQTVVFLDKRVQTMDGVEARPIFTADKQSLIIDWLVKWRIVEPRQFIRNSGTEMRSLENRFSPVVQAVFNDVITRLSVTGVLSTDRERVMSGVRERLAEEAKLFGIEIVDVRVKRVDFVAGTSERVFERMKSERQQVASKLRSTGNADAEKIRANADRQREVIVAEAYRDAQKVMGEGDAKATALYGDAFGRDPQFAHFYRSLQAYRDSFRTKSDVMVLDPNSDFFRAMRNGSPATAPAAPTAPARR